MDPLALVCNAQQKNFMKMSFTWFITLNESSLSMGCNTEYGTITNNELRGRDIWVYNREWIEIHQILYSILLLELIPWMPMPER